MSAYAVLFTFTRRTHLPLLIAASSLATLAGTIPPATSILVGKLMNFFSQFDAGSIDKNDLERKTQPWILGLVILGSGASLIRTLFYCAWIVNGEVQAKIVRENLFSSLVVRDYEWFEVQTSGLGSLLGRLQVYEAFKGDKDPKADMYIVKYASFSSQFLNPSEWYS